MISNVDSHDDLSAAPELIILHEKARPTNVAEIHSFQKISNFSCYSIPKYFVIRAALRIFITKNVKFN